MRGTSEACDKNSSLARPSVRSARIFLVFSRGNDEKSNLFFNLFDMNNVEEKVLRMSDFLLQVHDVAKSLIFVFRCLRCFFLEDGKIMSENSCRTFSTLSSCATFVFSLLFLID